MSTVTLANTPIASTLSESIPSVCRAVRTVGSMKPKFDADRQGFLPPTLDVVGSGFWLTPYNVFVTCAHVVERFNAPIEIVGMLVIGGNEHEYVKATISIIDQAHDLAILRPDLKPDSLQAFIKKEAETGLGITSFNPPVATRVYYAGFPFGNMLLDQKHSPTYSEGVIGSGIFEQEGEPKYIRISGPISGGFSGAPVVIGSDTDHSQLVGVVSHSKSKEIGDAGIFNAIHWKHVQSLACLATS